MIVRHVQEPHAGLPQGEDGEAEGKRRQEVGKAARGHRAIPMRCPATRPTKTDDPDEGGRQRGGGEEGGPDLHRLPIVRAREQAGAEAAVLALGDFRDHRADQRRRRADLHAGEEERRARGRAQLQERLQSGRRIGAHEIELKGIGRAKALHHADRDRKERQIGGDRRLGRDAGDVELIEDDDDHRRERDDGHRLRGDDPGHHRSLEPVHRDDENGKADAERRADEEADQRFLERDRAVIDEAALRGRRGREDELVEFAGDLMRSGKLRPLHVERIDDEVPGRIVGPARVGIGVALQRRVHQRRGDVPAREDGEDDGQMGRADFTEVTLIRTPDGCSPQARGTRCRS